MLFFFRRFPVGCSRPHDSTHVHRIRRAPRGALGGARPQGAARRHAGAYAATWRNVRTWQQKMQKLPQELRKIHCSVNLFIFFGRYLSDDLLGPWIWIDGWTLVGQNPGLAQHSGSSKWSAGFSPTCRGDHEVTLTLIDQH